MTHDLPLYQCHKTVRAVKLIAVCPSPSMYDPADQADGGGFLFWGDGQKPIQVSKAYLAKHQPKEGGYYVRYEDGYESFSPAEAFEGGYKKLHEGTLHVWHFVTETGKRFEVLTDKPLPPHEATIIDAHEVASFDWAALQRLRKASA